MARRSGSLARQPRRTLALPRPRSGARKPHQRGCQPPSRPPLRRQRTQVLAAPPLPTAAPTGRRSAPLTQRATWRRRSPCPSAESEAPSHFVGSAACGRENCDIALIRARNRPVTAPDAASAAARAPPRLALHPAWIDRFDSGQLALSRVELCCVFRVRACISAPACLSARVAATAHRALFAKCSQFRVRNAPCKAIITRSGAGWGRVLMQRAAVAGD